MTQTYDSFVVGLSVVIAVLASYAALSLTAQVSSATGRPRLAWLTGGATVMGIGIWSMHFVGMLAFSLPVPIGYSVPLLALSIVVAVVASLLALAIASRVTMSTRTLIGAGILMGAAICGMHYIGMASMRARAEMSYRAPVVMLSIGIAVVASMAALGLAYRLRAATSARAGLVKMAAALVMGAAISGMHYTGMAAAQFVPNDTMNAMEGGALLATSQLGQAIALGALVMIVLAIVGTVIDRNILNDRLATTSQLAAQAERLSRQTAELTVQAEQMEQQAMKLEMSNDELRLANERLEVETARAGAATQEAQRAAQAAQCAAQEASDANRARTKFINMSSHELRTPIGAIGGYTQLLLLGIRGPLTDEQKRDVERIDANHRHVLRLINEMLDLAKLEAGQMPVHLHECRICELLDATSPMIEPQLLEKQIAYSRRVDDCVPMVIGDPERLQQIIINLLANSIKFTPVSGSITVSANRRANTLELRFQDSGPGIPSDKRDTLFAPFAQLGVIGEGHIGTGLGLAISRELARAMGGSLPWTPTRDTGQGSSSPSMS